MWFCICMYKFSKIQVLKPYRDFIFLLRYFVENKIVFVYMSERKKNQRIMCIVIYKYLNDKKVFTMTSCTFKLDWESRSRTKYPVRAFNLELLSFWMFCFHCDEWPTRAKIQKLNLNLISQWRVSVLPSYFMTKVSS